MKLVTSLKNAETIKQRLEACNGLIKTERCDKDYLIVKRVWLFGSTVKDKQEPNDTDLLIELSAANRLLPYHRATDENLDKKQLHRFGIRLPRRSYEAGLKQLRKGLKMVRFHDFTIDEEVAQPRQLIYDNPLFNE